MKKNKKTVKKKYKRKWFEKTAIQYSNSISSEQGGSIGWVASKSRFQMYTSMK